jgi:DNA polymerase
MSHVEFIADPRFEVIGLGFADLREGGSLFAGPSGIDLMLAGFQEDYGPNLDQCTVVAHNTYFDLLLLREKYGITPAYTIDTLDLARHLDARDRHSLEHLAKKYGAPKPKGDTMQFQGLHAADMTPEQWEAMSEYCRGDIEITAFLLKKLLPMITRPDVELRIAAQNLRMFLEPKVMVDKALGEELLEGMTHEIDSAVAGARATGIWVEEPAKITTRTCRPPVIRLIEQNDISKDSTFVKLLAKALPEGESVPTKPDKNGKPIPALAKTDDACNYLLSHSSPAVRALMEARKATDSWRSHIKRVRRLLSQADCRGGWLGIPLNYYGGVTGRESGAGGINAQNFGARDVHPLIKRVGSMLTAPEGWTLGTGDLSQIEARVIAWLAGQTDLVEQFARGEDVYSDFAQNHVFHEETRKPREGDAPELVKALEIRRNFGKMAILALGYGMGGQTTYDRCLLDKSLRPLFDDGTYDIDFCYRLVNLYRKRYTKIVAYWGELQRAWKFVTKYRDQSSTVCHNRHAVKFYSIDDTTVMQLPSGRCMFYPHSRVSADDQLSYTTGVPKTKYYIYGGKLAENVTQAVARDVFMEGSLRCEDAGFPIVFRVHDQLITLIRDDEHAQDRLAEMHRLQTEMLPWAQGLPVMTEGRLTRCYAK